MTHLSRALAHAQDEHRRTTPRVRAPDIYAPLPRIASRHYLDACRAFLAAALSGADRQDLKDMARQMWLLRGHT
jgi:hypothetical protein